jgi:hypothetical protein
MPVPDACPSSWFSKAAAIEASLPASVRHLEDTSVITKTLAAEDMKKCKAVSWKRYQDGMMESKRICDSGCGYMWPAALGRGLTLLVKMRLSGLIVGSRACHFAAYNHLGADCWICGADGQREDYAHLLLHCRKWKELRRRYLQHLIKTIVGVLTAAKTPTTSANIVTLLIGGAVGGAKLKAWGWLKSSESTAVTCSPCTNWKHQPPYLCVAKFLQELWPRRTRIVAALSSKRAAPTGNVSN